jgi:hypothetical protein
MGAHQRPPGALVGAVDRQQALRRRDRRIRIFLLAQQLFGQVAAAVAQALAFGGEPGVECRVGAVEILQQVAVQQRQRGRLLDRRAHDLLDIDPGRAGGEREVVTGDDQNLVGTGRGQHFQQAMDLLAEGGARLFFRSAAPQQLGKTPAQGRARGGKRDHGQERAGFAPGRQDALGADGPGLHLADQPQPEDNRTRLYNRSGVSRGWYDRARHYPILPICVADASVFAR